MEKKYPKNEQNGNEHLENPLSDDTSEHTIDLTTASKIEQFQLDTTNLSLRDRAIVELLCSTGCRYGEISGLKIEDTDFERCEGTIEDELRNRRSIYFPNHVSKHIKDHLKSLPRSDSSVLFPSRHKKS